MPTLKLIREIVGLFDSEVLSASPQPAKRLIYKSIPTEVNITQDSSSIRWSRSQVTKDDWSELIGRFVEQRVKVLPQFAIARDQLLERAEKRILATIQGDHARQVEFWLTVFISRILDESVAGRLTQDSIAEYTARLFSELEGSELDFDCTVDLDGIYLEHGPIDIKRGAILRSAEASDFKHEEDGSEYLIGQVFGQSNSKVVLSLRYRASCELDCQTHLANILDAIRLYKLGSVRPCRTRILKHTVIWPMGAVLTGSDRQNAFRTSVIKEVDESKLSLFVDRVFDSVSQLNCDEKLRHIGISLQRYRSALLDPFPNDIRLMTSVMSMEALFLEDSDDRAGGQKLGLRLARLLGHLSIDPLRIRDTVGSAYRIRSKVVHGSRIDAKQSEEIAEVLPEFLNYSRLAILIFLLYPDARKSDLLKLINNSCISDRHNTSLKNQIEELATEFSFEISG